MGEPERDERAATLIGLGGGDEPPAKPRPAATPTLVSAQPPSFGPLAVGTMVGLYRVDGLIGRGTMGAVYRAHDTQLGRNVALKVVQSEHLGSPRAVERFLVEARATARFSHPNIVTVFGVGEVQGRPYVALELVEGEDLAERCRRRPPSLRTCLKILGGVAEGLAEAHRHGVVHRDLKPANVMLAAGDRPLVVDFGMAKLHGDKPGEGHHTMAGAGTPRYMSPEQWRELPTTEAADIWAWGVIAYELVMRRPLWESVADGDFIAAVCGERLAPAMTQGPPELAALVARCLEKDRARRPSASDVAQTIRRIEASLDAAPSSITPPAPPARLSWWLVPVVAGAVIVGATLTVIIAVAAGADWVKGRAPEDAIEAPAPRRRAPEPPKAALVPGDLAGRWLSERGNPFDAVVVGDRVEFRIADNERFKAQGYVLGEPRFVLRPEGDGFAVEDRLRPPHPISFPYEESARASCLVVLTQANGRPLRARRDGDRLIVEMALVEVFSENFVFSRLTVVGCHDLERLDAKTLEVVLRRP
jgi:hypothetical protein